MPTLWRNCTPKPNGRCTQDVHKGHSVTFEEGCMPPLGAEAKAVLLLGAKALGPANVGGRLPRASPWRGAVVGSGKSGFSG